VFPGANTGRGFWSFFDYLIPEDAERIFVIKGGPGVGKSTFMRRIAEKITDLGFDVEYHCCAADPNSLDGVVIPAFNIGLLDGTAPQVAASREERRDAYAPLQRKPWLCYLPGCRAADGPTLREILLGESDHAPDHVAADGAVQSRRNVAKIAGVVRDAEFRGDLLLELLQCLARLRDYWRVGFLPFCHDCFTSAYSIELRATQNAGYYMARWNSVW
jgi:hypothetical protein